MTFSLPSGIIKNMEKKAAKKSKKTTARPKVKADNTTVQPTDGNVPEVQSVSKGKPIQTVYVPPWRTNKMLRVYTSAAIILGLALAFLLREVTVYFFDLFLLVALVACVYDVINARQLRKADVKDYYIYTYLGIAYVVFFVGTILAAPFSFWMHLIAQVVVLFVWSLYTFFMYYVDKDIIKRCRLSKVGIGLECRRIIGRYWSVLVYPALFIFTLFALNHMAGAEELASVNFGLFALLMVFVISCATDTFAYIVGSLLKGPKLLSKKMRYISPKKTISGAIGGILGSWLGVLLLLVIFSSTDVFSDFMTVKIGDATAVLVLFSIIAIVGSIITQIGDIFASWIKRKAGIKDFGNYLPGHGGAMDRLDGILFNAMFIFIVMMIIAFVC